MTIETIKNILGENVRIYTPHPSDDAQNYALDTKYLTQDCPKCRANIPKKEAIELVLRVKKDTSWKWTPPRIESIEGTCVWGKYPKLLVERPRGPRHCEFFGKQHGEKRRPLLPED